MKTLLKSALACIMIIAATVISSAQPPQGQREQHTPEERAKNSVEQLKKELSLTDSQEKSIYDLQLKTSKEISKSRDAGQDDRKKMREQMEKLEKKNSEKMKEILSKEQFEKWEKMQTERRTNRNGRTQGKRPTQRQ